jgi:hypothetical protein
MSSGSPDLSAYLADARAALAAYDYDRARELLERAWSLDGGGLDTALPLFELLVDVLGLDADALALEPKLAREARRDDRVRTRLALAAARSGQVERALGWLEGLDEPEIACSR